MHTFMTLTEAYNMHTRINYRKL